MINKKPAFTPFVQRPIAAAMAVIVSMTTGCAQFKETESKAKQVQETAVALRDKSVANASSAAVSRTSRPKLGGEEIQLRAENALPAIFSKNVVYSTRGTQSLSEVMEDITGMSGILMRANEIFQGTENTNAASAQQPGANSAAGSSLPAKVQIEFSGTLRALLSELANRNDASWRYVPANRSVEFFKYETRTLSVHLPPGAKTVAASISLSGVSGTGGGSGGGSSGGSGGAGQVSVSQNLTVDPWSSIMSGVQSILGDNVRAGSASSANPAQSNSAAGSSAPTVASGPAGRASANPSFGIITVTARPAAVERIASYINSINARFAQNVMIDIKIYNLALDSQASLGFSLDLLYQKLSSYGVSVVGSAPLQAGSGTPGQLTLSSNSPSSRWNGSQVVAQALSQFGNVALQTQGQVLAINGQPSPIQVANEVNYLASSATTTAANVGTTSTLTPGTRVVGFTANFLPLILGDNRILLQYQMQISALTALTQVNSGTASIQTPQISSQSLQQQAFVKDGQAIVLFGFDQNRDTANTAAGIGGASSASRSERQMVVIVMQVNGGSKDAGI